MQSSHFIMSMGTDREQANPAGFEHGRSRTLELSALAGLETGVIGGLSLLTFLCAHSALRGVSWWSYTNLLGSVVYGPSALRRGFGRATLAGLAVEILLSGFAGLVFGVCFARTRGRLMSLLLGLSCGVIWFFISFGTIFRVIGPLVPVYASQPATLLGHMIFGFVLSRTSLVYQDWPAGWRLLEGPKGPEGGSGIPNATERRGTAEIVPQHRLE
jgi:hypothetical protein